MRGDTQEQLHPGLLEKEVCSDYTSPNITQTLSTPAEVFQEWFVMPETACHLFRGSGGL